MTRKEFAIACAGVVVVAALSTIDPVAAESQPSHIHSGHHRIQEVIRFALARSESLQDLNATLDLSDVVYVEEETGSDSEHLSCIRLMPNANNLLIHFDPRPPIRTAAAVLAHELYHAAEISRAPTLVDNDSLRVLHGQIGDLSSHPRSRYDCWETRTAQTSNAIYTVKPDGSDETLVLGPDSSAAEPLVGLWRLQRQEIDGNATDFEPPLALQISQAKDRLRFAFSVPRPDIYFVTITYTLRLDGSEADIIDGTNQKVGTIQMTRSGPGQYLLTMKGSNRPDAQGKLTISANGRTLISESDAMQSGHSVHSKQIFARN